MKTASDSAGDTPAKAPTKRTSKAGKSASATKPPARPSSNSDAADEAALPQLPHERDQVPEAAGDNVRPKMEQARKDIERGLVDTDMRSTPGLDAQQRKKLVKTPPR